MRSAYLDFSFAKAPEMDAVMPVKILTSCPLKATCSKALSTSLQKHVCLISKEGDESYYQLSILSYTFSPASEHAFRYEGRSLGIRGHFFKQICKIDDNSSLLVNHSVITQKKSANE